MNGNYSDGMKSRGFTLIELIVVMLIISLLVTLAVPRYFGSVEKSKDAILKSDLSTIREALDKYYGDRGQYPETLQELVTQKYLRNIPIDPITESKETWQIVPPESSEKGGVFDIHSGAEGTGLDGSPYKDW